MRVLCRYLFVEVESRDGAGVERVCFVGRWVKGLGIAGNVSGNRSG